jgi:putative ABC transport system ATP-binding protein
VSLLSLQGVSKRYRRGRREYVALIDVSLSIERGELVAVLGLRRSGRSTLLRIVAGLELPDDGVVRFEGEDLSLVRDVLGRRIAYCHTSFSASEGYRVVEHLAAGPLARHATPLQARREAEAALARVGASDCARMEPYELDGAESVRVAIARALTAAPSLLVIDEPTSCIDVLQRDPILDLLRSIADEGVAVLMSTGDATCLAGVDRAFSLDEGELRLDEDESDASDEPYQADIVPLRRQSQRVRVDPEAHAR